MLTTNPERNEIIYKLWEQGSTVSEISSTTGIPRSTVGYYVRKFNKYANDGKPIVLPQKQEEDKSNALKSALTKWVLFDKISDLIKSKDYRNAYYLLEVCKLLDEIQITFTSEESKAFNEALISAMSSKD